MCIYRCGSGPAIVQLDRLAGGVALRRRAAATCHLTQNFKKRPPCFVGYEVKSIQELQQLVGTSRRRMASDQAASSISN